MAHLNLGAWPPGNLAETDRISSRLAAIVALWGLIVLAALGALWHYEAAPGDGGSAPAVWPAQSKIVRDGRPTLLVFAHPLCPCTRATLAELERLVAVSHDKFDTHVLFIAPEGTDAAWRDSELYRMASRIPNVTIHADASRHETDLFRERTSGSCLLYDAQGKLLFNGGLTSARGHEGGNQGIDSIKALMAGQAAVSATPVFGCPLFECNAQLEFNEQGPEPNLVPAPGPKS